MPKKKSLKHLEQEKLDPVSLSRLSFAIKTFFLRGGGCHQIIVRLDKILALFVLFINLDLNFEDFEEKSDFFYFYLQTFDTTFILCIYNNKDIWFFFPFLRTFLETENMMHCTGAAFRYY